MDGTNPTKSETETTTTLSDNESLLSSTSNAFNSWTILPSERIEVLDNTVEELPSCAQNIKNRLSNECEQLASEKCKPMEDSQADDISDGISIISDCESTERLSPHPFLREQLNDLNFKFETGDELPASLLLPGQTTPPTTSTAAIKELRHRRNDDEPNAEADVLRADAQLEETKVIANRHTLPAFVQSGLTGLFYVCATLAILAFVGKLRHPEWQVLGNGQPIAELEQRLNELELQNNLMRAEIDIISKQLNYLSTVAGAVHGQAQSSSSSSQYQNARKPKTFKAWSGNGAAVDPVDITKADLKRPYVCPDGKYVEFAAMCLENAPHVESLADEIGNVVNNVLQNSQAFQNFEKVTEKVSSTLNGASNNNEAGANAADAQTAQTGTTNTNYQPKSSGKDFNSRSTPTNNSKERYKNKQEYAKDHSKERYKQHNEPKRFKSKEDDSKEHYAKKYAGAHSKERYNKYVKPHDRAKHEKYRERDDSGSGEWHEKMMQHREQARRQHDQNRDNKNWYIERGNSREQMRF